MAKAKTHEEIMRLTLSTTECKDLIKHQLFQVLKYGPQYHGKIFFLEGLPGIGKTQMQAQILKEVCAELTSWKESDFYNKNDYEFFKNEQKSKGRLEVQNLSARDSGDFSGLPYNKEVKVKIEQEFVEKMMLNFSQPDFMPSQGIGTLFWDEANRVFDINLQAVLLSMWMDRGVNGHRLGDGYIQVCAGNLFEDKRFKTCQLDDAAKGRIAIIRLEPTVAEVIAFLEDKYQGDKAHFLVEYLKEHNEFCNLKHEAGFSPRDIDKAMEYTFSLRNVEDVLENSSKSKLLENALKIYFGAGNGTLIMNFIKNNKEITLKRIFDNPTLIKKVKGFNMPLQTALVKEVIDYCFTEKRNKKIPQKEREAITDLMKVLQAENLGQFIQALSDKTDTPEELQKVVEWLKKDVFTDPNLLSQVKHAWHEVSQQKQSSSRK